MVSLKNNSPSPAQRLVRAGAKRPISCYQFLEEFDGDGRWVEAAEPDDAPHLLAVLVRVVPQALGRQVERGASRAFGLRAHRFYYGNAAVGERVVLFFEFQEADTGLAALIPGVRGAMEVARFRLTAGLLDPRMN